jgi:cytochrome c553
MDKRAALSIVLLVVGIGTCALVAFGVGTDPPERAAPEGPLLSEVATPDEHKLWTTRGCATCHGPDARGGLMAPDLAEVIPLYLARFGSPEAARERLAAFMLNPAGSPRLRNDGELFPNPMPSLLKLYGGRREDAPVLAGMLLRLAK